VPQTQEAKQPTKGNRPRERESYVMELAKKGKELAGRV